jgi:hypothetical protein
MAQELDQSAANYRYILRYLIDPHRDAGERLEELVGFCREARIDEVMLLLQAEELSAGHPTRREWADGIALARRMSDRLAHENIGLSINPWSTTYGVTRGRKLREGQKFQRMVGETGIEHPLAACPLCPEWQTWLAECFAELAREVRPLAIWMEDDWRLHNHGAVTGWGGCFCPIHLRRFSEMIGEKVTREQVLAAVLHGGEPHPWRQAWLDLSRETILEPTRAITDAIRQANPTTRVGWMTSMPDQHSVEGRDWARLREASGESGAFLIRPHMPPYTQQRPLRVTPWPTRHTLACLHGEIEVYPELENSPRCGVYSKSATATGWQMIEAAVLGSHGITINHFDNMGNGIALDRHLAPHLAALRPQLDALAALRLDNREADGVQVLFSPRIAAALRLPEGEAPVTTAGDFLALNRSLQAMGGGAGSGIRGSMQALVHPSVVWSEVCGILGIAHRLSSRVEPQLGPILVSGQTLEAFSDAEIASLLGGFVVLDAVAAEGLLRRGFGDQLGIRSGIWQAQEETAYSYEQIEAADAAAYGVAHPRMCAQRCADRVWAMDCHADAKALSTFFTAEHQALWPAALEFRNARSGRVVTLAYPLDGGSQFFMAFFSIFRRLFLQNLFLADPRGARLAMSADGTRCYRSKTAQGTLFSVLNALEDRLDRVEIRHSPDESFIGQWCVLEEDGTWRATTPRTGPGRLEFDLDVPPLRGRFLRHLSFDRFFNAR